MMSKKILLGFVPFVIMVILSVGCYKDTVVPSSGIVIVITKPVSFSKDILPIFAKNCALSGCHVSRGQAPDLSSGNAYTSLTTANLVSTSAPETSEIYRWLIGKGTLQMPPSGINPTINAMVLAWIKQGAKND